MALMFKKAMSNKELILEKLSDEQRLPVIDYHGASIVIAGAGSGSCV